MSEILLAPRVDSEATPLPGDKPRWKKKILKRGTINYKGRKIDFTDDYLKNIVSAYADGAMDQVAFQLADDQNKHNLDPKRFGGDADKVYIGDDGDLWAEFELQPGANELVKANPKLGVSVSLAENPDRADGKKYPVVLGHVLGTLDPRVKGLGGWTPVNLSGYDAADTYIDLSEAEVIDAPRALPDITTLADLTEADIDAMDEDEIEAWFEAVAAAEAANPTDPPAAPVVTPEPIVAPVAKEPVVAALSVTEEQRAIELAAAAQTRADLDAMRAELATEKYEKLRALYVSRGVPAAMVELARPLLEVPQDSVINLSEDKSVNATDTVRQMLDQMAGFVKLNQEKGLLLSVTPEETDPTRDAAKAAEADLLKRMAEDPAWN